MSVPEQLTAAVRAAWCRGTCDDSDLADWSPANPARGQCGATALVLHDLLGGNLLLAEVLRPDGSRQGVHWWNRLPDGTEADLTREQFAPHEVVQAPRVVVRPPGPPRRNREQYLRLRAAVLRALGERAQAPG
ncbi:YunG family protein [Geodermatophilus sp. SYSU D00766]